MRIAITGHRGLPAATEHLVENAIRALLASHAAGDHLVGISALADGADQIFARAILDAGGQLEVIVPAARYRDGLPEPAHASYDALLAAAATVDRLDYVESTEEAHMAASRAMLSRTDLVFAVWDGKPARGYGGTADVVAEASSRGRDAARRLVDHPRRSRIPRRRSLHGPSVRCPWSDARLRPSDRPRAGLAAGDDPSLGRQATPAHH